MREGMVYGHPFLRRYEAWTPLLEKAWSRFDTQFRGGFRSSFSLASGEEVHGTVWLGPNLRH